MAEFLPQKTVDVSSVAAGLRDSREHVRLASMAESLTSNTVDASIGQGVAACLNDTNRSARQLAAVVLGQMGAPAVSVLTEALDENQPVSVRIAAASGLARSGADAVLSVEQLCRCLENTDGVLRWHAGFALSKIGRPAVPPLRNMLSSSDETLLRSVVAALGWMGPEARDAAEAIKRLIPFSSPALRLACHSALIKITGDSSASLPVMLGALQDKDASVRKAAIEHLGELREIARPSAPNILPCLSDSSAEVRAAVALALARVNAGGTTVVEGLMKLLQDPEAEVRANAGMALANFGPAAAPALPALKNMQAGGDARLTAIAKAAIEVISGTV